MTQLPPDIRAAALEAALHDTLAALEATGQGSARLHGAQSFEGAAIRRTATYTSSDAMSHQFAVVLKNGGRTLRARLSTNAAGLSLMGRVAVKSPRAAGPLSCAALPLTLRAEIGAASLTHAELSSLQAGDAIMLADSFVSQRGELRLGSGNWSLHVKADGPQLVITRPFHLKELQEMDPTPSSSIESDMPASLDDIPVRLTFDLGEQTLPLGEVRSLQVGQVLELDRPLSQAVTIRANGAWVGTGELVEVGGRLAVSIAQLGRAPGAVQ